MTITERLSRMVDGLSDRQAVLIPVVEIREWLEVEHRPVRPNAPFTADLTIEEAAQIIGRQPSTVRGWLNAGLMPGAYKLNGKQWRLPPEVLQSFQERQRQMVDPPATPQGRRRTAATDLGGWKEEIGVRAA